MNKINNDKLLAMPEDEQLFRRDRRHLVCYDPYTNPKWIRMPLIEVETKTFDSLVQRLHSTVRELTLLCGVEVGDSLSIDETISMLETLKKEAIIKRYNA